MSEDLAKRCAELEEENRNLQFQVQELQRQLALANRRPEPTPHVIYRDPHYDPDYIPYPEED